MVPVLLPSARVKKPDNQGGPIARQGFSYQDDVAVKFVLEMHSNPKLLEMLCETQDDIVLIWKDQSGAESAEYVQVKAGKPEKLWSIADLCKRKGTNAEGTSLYEGSLLRDCCIESSLFRIVTRIPIVSELEVLSYPLESHGRTTNVDKIALVVKTIEEKLPNIKSVKGNGAEFWVHHCQWKVCHDAQSLENENRLAIMNLAAQQGFPLLPEQITVLLGQLRSLVKIASDASWDPEPNVKRLLRTAILAWWKERLQELTQSGNRAAGKLAFKLSKAQLSPEQIRLAADLRRGYSANVRIRHYMEKEDLSVLQQSVRAELMVLSSQYLAGDLQLTPSQFHARCVDALTILDGQRPANTPTRKGMLLGCMYDIADRCLHRFDRRESL